MAFHIFSSLNIVACFVEKKMILCDNIVNQKKGGNERESETEKGVKSTLLKFANAKLCLGHLLCIDLYNFILSCLHIDFCQIKIVRLLLLSRQLFVCLPIELSQKSKLLLSLSYITLATGPSCQLDADK